MAQLTDSAVNARLARDVSITLSAAMNSYLMFSPMALGTAVMHALPLFGPATAFQSSRYRIRH